MVIQQNLKILIKHKIDFNDQIKEIETWQFGSAKGYADLETLISDEQVSEDISELTEIYRRLMVPVSEILNKMISYKLTIS